MVISVKDIQLFKLNEDDILEIVSEYVAEKTGIKEFSSKSIALGVPSKDLRVIVAVSNESLSDIDLFSVDEEIEYNGEHSRTDGLNNDDMLSALDKMISTGEF